MTIIGNDIIRRDGKEDEVNDDGYENNDTGHGDDEGGDEDDDSRYGGGAGVEIIVVAFLQKD